MASMKKVTYFHLPTCPYCIRADKILDELLREHPEFKMPFIIRNHSGRQMCDRLSSLIQMLKLRGHEFGTYTPFAIQQAQRLNAQPSQATHS